MMDATTGLRAFVFFLYFLIIFWVFILFPFYGFIIWFSPKQHLNIVTYDAILHICSTQIQQTPSHCPTGQAHQQYIHTQHKII